MLSDKILEIIENSGFVYNLVHQKDKDVYIELNQDTPAGEDWWCTISFNGTDEDFINSMRKFVYSFDIDEEVEIWIDSRGKNGVPSSIKVLVEDAEWKYKQLENLLDTLERYKIIRGE